jgi:site-specific DNA-cytosine methylase
MLGEGLAKGVPVWVNGNQPNAARREIGQPAPTMLFGHNMSLVYWANGRPSRTVNADERISEPGRHDPNESGSQQKNAVRVSVQEAAALQSFRKDVPWEAAGSRTARFRIIGNSCPPALMIALVGEMLGLDWQPIHRAYLERLYGVRDLEGM